jgi:hypothetical protein
VSASSDTCARLALAAGDRGLPLADRVGALAALVASGSPSYRIAAERTLERLKAAGTIPGCFEPRADIDPDELLARLEAR